MSKITGRPFATGMPNVSGLIESRRSRPPNGTVNIPEPVVFTNCTATMPSAAAISAQ